MRKGEFLWAIGGKIENKFAVGDITVYNIEDNEWYSSKNGQLCPMPHPVQGAGWTFFEDKIFSFGGKTKPHSGCCDYVQVYKIQDDSWELYQEMPEPRSKLGKYYPVVENHFIYLFGGDNALGRYHRVNWNWRYDLVNDSWDMEVADAPFSQSFPLPSYYNGWLYFSTGNTGTQSEQNVYEGSLNQRYNPKEDTWEIMTPCPIPTTDGSGDRWQNELHIIGGWNTNDSFYNPSVKQYQGPVKKQHLVYNYKADTWHFKSELPAHWHHGGTRASKKYLWRFLGTIDEDIDIQSHNPHSNKIFRWNGTNWTEMNAAPVRKMNFGTIYSTVGPDFGNGRN